MKKTALGLIMAALVSLPTQAAPTIYFNAITNSAPFNQLLAQSGAELEAITHTESFDCPGCFGFDVDVVYPDDSGDTWYFTTQLSPSGEIWVSLVPKN